MMPQNVDYLYISGSILNNIASSSILITGSTNISYYFRSSSVDQYVQYQELNINFNINTDYYQFKVYSGIDIQYQLIYQDETLHSLNNPDIIINDYTYPNIQIILSASKNIYYIENNNITLQDIYQSLCYTHNITTQSIYDSDITIKYQLEGI